MVLPFMVALAEPRLVTDMVDTLRQSAAELNARKTARPDPAAGVALNGLHPELMARGGMTQVVGINAQHDAGFTPFGPLGVLVPSAPSPGAASPSRPASKGRGFSPLTYEA